MFDIYVCKEYGLLCVEDLSVYLRLYVKLVVLYKTNHDLLFSLL